MMQNQIFKWMNGWVIPVTVLLSALGFTLTGMVAVAHVHHDATFLWIWLAGVLLLLFALRPAFRMWKQEQERQKTQPVK